MPRSASTGLDQGCVRFAKGLEGELVVGQFLERLRADGFTVFHDVIGAGFNIDHVLIGPAGVFTIETKTWSKPASGDARVTFDGEKISVGGLKLDRDPVTQAKGQAAWLRTVLSESTGRKVEARPVIVFPGWFVEGPRQGYKDVWVLEPKALPAFLASEPAPLSEQRQIVAKVGTLMALCDRLEGSLSSDENYRRRLLSALLSEAVKPADALEEAA